MPREQKSVLRAARLSLLTLILVCNYARAGEEKEEEPLLGRPPVMYGRPAIVPAFRGIPGGGAILENSQILRAGKAILMINFESGGATLTPADRGVVTDLAQLLDNDHIKTIRLIGHTDASGDAALNMELSRRRAEAVAEVLRPLVKTNVLVEGKGADEPFDSSILHLPPTPAERAILDRRVEVEIVER